MRPGFVRARFEDDTFEDVSGWKNRDGACGRDEKNRVKRMIALRWRGRDFLPCLEVRL